MPLVHAENTLNAQVARLKDHLFGFVNIYLLNTGLELGLFEMLHSAGNGGLTVAELARRKNLHEPYLSQWCRCAYGCGYLDILDGERFCLAPHMDAILTDVRHPAYMGHILRFFATYSSLDFLDHIEYLQTGEVFPVLSHGEGFTKLLAQTGVTKGVKFLEQVVSQIPSVATMLENGASMCDVGCGSGTFLRPLAQAYPRCRFVGVDNDPDMVCEAKRAITEAGLRERVRVLLRNATTLTFDNAFDLITMNSVLREIPSQQKPTVMDCCFSALKPGGTVLITDFTLPDALPDLRDPAHRAVLMDLLVEMTWGRYHQSEHEQIALLTHAGFVNVCHRPLGDQTYTLLSGEKPQ